jgi:hypothetical protein
VLWSICDFLSPPPGKVATAFANALQLANTQSLYILCKDESSGGRFPKRRLPPPEQFAELISRHLLPRIDRREPISVESEPQRWLYEASGVVFFRLHFKNYRGENCSTVLGLMRTSDSALLPRWRVMARPTFVRLFVRSAGVGANRKTVIADFKAQWQQYGGLYPPDSQDDGWLFY